MIAKLFSAISLGLEPVLVPIETDIAHAGLPSFTIVGLADRSLNEARERVRAAIRNSGADFPIRRITVNLAPASLPKEGSMFDLPIAISILVASLQLQVDLSRTLLIGELSLDGLLRSVNGVLPLVILAQKIGFTKVIVPEDNGQEAALVEGIEVYGCKSLVQVCDFLCGRIVLAPVPLSEVKAEIGQAQVDFENIIGQEQAKRALMIAAAGGHNVLMTGPPGSGKSMLAKAFPGILPPLNRAESLEVTQIYSVAGKLEKDKSVVVVRPFRSPHHTASFAGMVGGGGIVKPGEISLAHLGVLFLDEIAEFSRPIIEALRQPLEDNQITLSRLGGSYVYPARFILVATQNPCPCGYFGSLQKECLCSANKISVYQKRLSGPILDRIDLSIYVAEVDLSKLNSPALAENSITLRASVIKAREVQEKRFKDQKILVNAQMTNEHLKIFCYLSERVQGLLNQALEKLSLSARSYYRLIKVARTIADLEGSEDISVEHLAEAIQFR